MLHCLGFSADCVDTVNTLCLHAVAFVSVNGSFMIGTIFTDSSARLNILSLPICFSS
jgi:hypothetical protein